MEKARFHFDNYFSRSPLECGSFAVHQIGDLSCGFQHCIGPHKQHCYELSLILSGEGIFIINNERFKVKRGDLILNKKNEMHSIESNDGHPLRFLYLGFDFNETAEPGYIQIKQFFDETNERITPGQTDLNALFFAVFKELGTGAAYSTQLITGYITEIIIKGYRVLRGDSEKSAYAPEIPGASANDTLYAVINALDSQAPRLNSLSEIGSQFGYSYAYLSKLFSKRVGMTIFDYFQTRLFGRAASLLEGGATVTETAEKLGYSSIHNFSRAFSKYYGVSPSKYITRNDKH